jgi:hypothetical protein
LGGVDGDFGDFMNQAAAPATGPARQSKRGAASEAIQIVSDDDEDKDLSFEVTRSRPVPPRPTQVMLKLIINLSMY